MHNVPNFLSLEYVMVLADGNYQPGVTPESIESDWRGVLERTYFSKPNSFSIERNGSKYPCVFLFEEAALRGVFDHFEGSQRVLAFYAKMAALFQAHGFGGLAVMGRHPISLTDAERQMLEAAGVLHYDAEYGDGLSPNQTSYSAHVQAYQPPVDPHTIVSTATSLSSHNPHPSGWVLPGSRPELFGDELTAAIEHVIAHDMPRIVTVYSKLAALPLRHLRLTDAAAQTWASGRRAARGCSPTCEIVLATLRL